MSVLPRLGTTPKSPLPVISSLPRSSLTTLPTYNGHEPLSANISLKSPSHILSLAAPPFRVRPTGPSCRNMASRQCWRGSISSTPLRRGPLLSRSSARAPIGTRVLPSCACNYHVQPRLELALASVREIR